MNQVSLLLAFAAGILSFLSPCILPLIPAYISYITGITLGEISQGKAKLTILYKSLGFIFGFSLVFIVMGLSISSIGRFLVANQRTFSKISGIIIILLGLHMTGVFKIKILYREKKFFTYGEKLTHTNPILMGIAFAGGWTPCAGPILSTIYIYSSNTATFKEGLLLLIFYCLGLAIPFILTALTIESLSKYLKKLSKHSSKISIVIGIFIILMGVMVYSNKLQGLINYFSFMPSF